MFAKSNLKTITIVTISGLAGFGICQSLKDNNINKKIFGSPSNQSSSIINDKNDKLGSSSSLSLPLPLFDEVISKSFEKLSVWKTVKSIPGYVIGVSYRGKNIWIHADGYSDLENGVRCTPETKMRIASISKAIAASMLAKLVQDKKIDWNRSVWDYVKETQFPKKQWDGQDVDFTVKQLAGHLSGIRHYKVPEEKKSEFESCEYYIKESYHSVNKSLSLFKDDPLVAKPGTKFCYSTFGYTLLSAVIENQMESKNFARDFQKFIREELGMSNTVLDSNETIIYNRSKYYFLRFIDKLVNAPYVDNSYKWAGGGLLSTIPDLLKFGNLMLYSFKGEDHQKRPGYLDRQIVEEMWTPQLVQKEENKFSGYGIGFSIYHNSNTLYAFAYEPPFENASFHTGTAVGATSLLLIEPKHELVLAIITNLRENDTVNIGMNIAKDFITEIEKSQASK